MKNKLSEKVLQLALTVLKDPQKPPSSEAAHAALLFVHVAWNRSLGDSIDFSNYEKMLKQFEKSNPLFWNEFKKKAHLKIINRLIDQKNRLFFDDKRKITVCRMRKGNVHVEWA
jgi:hypothetical protein